MDLTKAQDGVVEVANKPSRVEKLQRSIDTALAEGRLAPREARTLKGKLLYASGQAFAKLGAAAARALQEHVDAKRWELEPKARWALAWWRQFLEEAQPRRLTTSVCRRPVVISTDGAVEIEAGATMGAIALWPDGGIRHYGETIPEAIVERWAREAGKTGLHAIGQAEIAPVSYTHLTLPTSDLV